MLSPGGSTRSNLGADSSPAASSSGWRCARALLLRPDWLFLDEATSSLDPEAEADLYTALRRRLPKTTMVSIAHRPDVRATMTRRSCSSAGRARPALERRQPATMESTAAP